MMLKNGFFAKKVNDHEAGLCWAVGRVAATKTVAVHLSLGPPVWLKPDLGLKKYNGITEYRAGWLLAAVQVAVKPKK